MMNQDKNRAKAPIRPTATKRGVNGTINAPSGRKDTILRALIQEFIRTVSPVSSKSIATGYSVGLKSASIRSIMAELLMEGLLRRAHSSAGCVPTDKSFRLYVDKMLELEELRDDDMAVFVKTTTDASADKPNNLLRETTKALSDITHCAGVVMAPRADLFKIKNIRLLTLDEKRVMVVIVGMEGIVHSRMVSVERTFSPSEIERISNYLNSIARGLGLQALRDKVIEEMRGEKQLYDNLLKEALRLGQEVFDKVSGDCSKESLYLEGQSQVMEQPEFQADFDSMKRLFRAFEEKSQLVKILEKSINDSSENGIHIYLGSEDETSRLDGLSLVVAPYGKDGQRLGTLGVIGPIRMDYSRIIPVVNYAANSLSDFFDQ
jgi:heat-inducible transcriptional repressor